MEKVTDMDTQLTEAIIVKKKKRRKSFFHF